MIRVTHSCGHVETMQVKCQKCKEDIATSAQAGAFQAIVVEVNHLKEVIEKVKGRIKKLEKGDHK